MISATFTARNFRRPWRQREDRRSFGNGYQTGRITKIFYVDIDNGSDGSSGLTFALRKKTISSAMSSMNPGDLVKVMASTDPVSTGQNATWTDLSSTVTLAS